MGDWVETEIRVRYAETDAMGVAHHSHYLVWFEAARAEFCRARGIDYVQMERDGMFLPVAEARCRYRAPARYEDVLGVRVRVTMAKRGLARFEYEVINNVTGVTLAEGETVQALTGRDGKVIPFPPEIAARLIG